MTLRVTSLWWEWKGREGRELPKKGQPWKRERSLSWQEHRLSVPTCGVSVHFYKAMWAR